MITIGWSLFLIGAGAILRWAVTAHADGINLQKTGVILMVVGAVGLVIAVLLLVSGRSEADQASRSPSRR